MRFDWVLSAFFKCVNCNRRLPASQRAFALVVKRTLVNLFKGGVEVTTSPLEVTKDFVDFPDVEVKFFEKRERELVPTPYCKRCMRLLKERGWREDDFVYSRR